MSLLNYMYLMSTILFKYANHMTMTTNGQIMSWPVYLKTKGNVNIKLWDLCEILVVYILLSTFESVHMLLTVNKPDVRRFIAWIESADWNPCYWSIQWCTLLFYRILCTYLATYSLYPARRAGYVYHYLCLVVLTMTTSKLSLT